MKKQPDTIEADAYYLIDPTSRKILALIARGASTIKEIAIKTGFDPVEVASWLADLKVRGFVKHSIGVPKSKVEAQFSLTPKAAGIVADLQKDFLE